MNDTPESQKIPESDEISSMTVAAILKMFVCGVSRAVPCSCHDNMRYLLYLTFKVKYSKYLISQTKYRGESPQHVI